MPKDQSRALASAQRRALDALITDYLARGGAVTRCAPSRLNTGLLPAKWRAGKRYARALG